MAQSRNKKTKISKSVDSNFSSKKSMRNKKKSEKRHIVKKETSSNFKSRIVKKSKPGMRLNQYIAHSGISSRREADQLIKAGLVSVNNKIITEMGFRVMPTDAVKFNNETISSEKKVYLLLNKPKGFLTSIDPQKNKTVADLISGACKERVYPVGRLDRQASGLLLFTNDGEISKKLTDPKQKIKTLYHIELDKNLKVADMKKLVDGLRLEQGFLVVNKISYVTNSPKKEIGMELLYGKNKSIRSAFNQLGYRVVKLDRVFYGGLTKKDIPRGRHRFLNDQEINMLKMI